MALFSRNVGTPVYTNDRDYDISVEDTSGRRAGSVRYHCNAIPPVGGSVMLGGKKLKVVDVMIDYDAMARQTQHQGTKVPVKVVVE